jgi:hypothetical protein
VQGSEGNLTTIIPNQTFKHDGETYERGESYEVSDEDATYFRAAGWVGERQPTSEITLNVHGLQLGVDSWIN